MIFISVTGTRPGTKSSADSGTLARLYTRSIVHLSFNTSQTMTYDTVLKISDKAVFLPRLSSSRFNLRLHLWP